MKKIFLLAIFTAVQLNAAQQISIPIPSTDVFDDEAANNAIGVANLPKVIFEDKNHHDYDIYQLEVQKSKTACAINALQNAVATLGILNSYDQIKNCKDCKEITDAKTKGLVEQFNNYTKLLKSEKIENYLFKKRHALREEFKKSCGANSIVGPIDDLKTSTAEPEVIALLENITTILASFKDAEGFPHGIPFVSPDMITLQMPNALHKANGGLLTHLNPQSADFSGIADNNLLLTVLGFRKALKDNETFRRGILLQLNDEDNSACRDVTHIMALIIDVPKSKNPKEKAKPRFIILNSNNGTNIVESCIVANFKDLLFNESKGTINEIAEAVKVPADDILAKSVGHNLNFLAKKNVLSDDLKDRVVENYNKAKELKRPNYVLAALQVLYYFGKPLPEPIADVIDDANDNLNTDYHAYMGCTTQDTNPTTLNHSQDNKQSCLIPVDQKAAVTQKPYFSGHKMD